MNLLSRFVTRTKPVIPTTAPPAGGLPSVKTAKLIAFIEALPIDQAVVLLKATEAMPSGSEGIPADFIIRTLQSRIRAARGKAYPTLFEIAVDCLSAFTTELHILDGFPGLVVRERLGQWWECIEKIGSVDIKLLQAERLVILDADDQHAWAIFAAKAMRIVATHASRLGDAAGGGMVASAIPAFLREPEALADCAQISIILQSGNKLAKAIAAVFDVAALDSATVGQEIFDLTPRAVTEAKKQYKSLTEPGEDGICALNAESAPYFALGLMNRFKSPWHVLRLSRAIAWTRDERLICRSEFFAIGERLLQEIAVAARRVALAMQKGRGAPDAAALSVLVDAYADAVEGVIGELDMRRDSPWGEILLKSRVVMRDALNARSLQPIFASVSAVVPLDDRSRTRGNGAPADTAIPSLETVSAALSAASLLMCIAHRGARHGFSAGVREAVDSLWQEIERRAGPLLEEIQSLPGADGAAAQVDAAAQVARILFHDDRGDILGRRLVNALHAATA